MPASWPASSAEPRIDVNESRLRKPVWMSRARSVPAFMVENRAPWMNGTASAKARKECVGKPGSCVDALKPAALTDSSAHGEDEWRNGAGRLSQRPHHGAPGDRADLCREGAFTSASGRKRGLVLVAGTFERAARLGEEDIVQGRLLKLQVRDDQTLGVERTDDVCQPGGSVSQPHRDVPRRSGDGLAEPGEHRSTARSRCPSWVSRGRSAGRSRP